jgi:hypothetical protein
MTSIRSRIPADQTRRGFSQRVTRTFSATFSRVTARFGGRWTVARLYIGRVRQTVNRATSLAHPIAKAIIGHRMLAVLVPHRHLRALFGMVVFPQIITPQLSRRAAAAATRLLETAKGHVARADRVELVGPVTAPVAPAQPAQPPRTEPSLNRAERRAAQRQRPSLHPFGPGPAPAS